MNKLNCIVERHQQQHRQQLEQFSKQKPQDYSLVLVRRVVGHRPISRISWSQQQAANYPHQWSVLEANEQPTSAPSSLASLTSETCEEQLEEMSLQSPTNQQHSPKNQTSSQSANATTSLHLPTDLADPSVGHQTPLAIPNPNPILANPDTRTHVVGELYDTERSYVESLQILVEKYMKPLKSLDSSRSLIESNLVDEIFYTIPEILQHHETFLSALQDRLSSDWDTSQVIGNVFIEAFTNQQIIDTYTAFINNWKNARQAIKIATQARPAFERFLEAMSREHRNKLTLDALLIMPVQRIPRYELLIKELIKHTPDDHPDNGPLMEAQKEIHKLALKIDHAEKEMIHQEQLKDLESLIDGHVELQHPQRDFIRYDLVTILGASALTVAKKERVLFLFCDLLIMTSVKKKASKRSNLQAAFVNSSNDLSLLEGNKFKLLLRVSLDQVEIKLANDELQIQQQLQQQIQQQLQQQHNNKLIQDRKREIEADLCTLHQMESLSTKISLVDKAKVNESISELSSQLRQRLFNLEQGDFQLSNRNYQANSAQVKQDPYVTQSSTSASVGTSMQSSIQGASTSSQPSTATNQFPAPNSGSTLQGTLANTLTANVSPSTNQESDTSLEFIISNNNSLLKDSLSTNLSTSPANSDSLTVDQGFQPADDQTSAPTTDSQATSQFANQQMQPMNCDTLVVTFASIDRRQAFLHAFMEAKQQRYQQLQQQRLLNPSSITMVLSQSDRHQQQQQLPRYRDSLDSRIELARASNSSSSRAKPPAKYLSHHIHNLVNPTSHRISAQHPCGGTIVHQMSAPQSMENDNERSAIQCAYCSTDQTVGFDRSHSHHHHQLMRQPASHPAYLDTICCLEQHNDDHDPTELIYPSVKHLGLSNELTRKGDPNCYQDYYWNVKQKIVNNQIINLDDDTQNPSHIPSSNQSLQFLYNNNDGPVSFRSIPKFLDILPMNFLSTQHPALQFTCSTLRSDCQIDRAVNDSSKGVVSAKQNRQAFRDNTGQLWLCLSNGYVSHIALVSMKKKNLKSDSEPLDCCNSDSLKGFTQIVPVVQSAGDICKSHIGCATQVRWITTAQAEFTKPKKLIVQGQQLKIDQTETSSEQALSRAGTPTIEVAVKSASPPVIIKSRSNLLADIDNRPRLSESAPSQSETSALGKSIQKRANTFASTTRLEVPSGRTSLQVKPPQTGQQSVNVKSYHEKLAHEVMSQRNFANNSKQTESLSSASTSKSPHQLTFQRQNARNLLLKENSRSSYGHYHHHGHHHSHTHHLPSSQSHHLYSARHHTVPIAELRKALDERNGTVSQHRSDSHRIQQLPSPSNAPVERSSSSQQRISSLDLAERRVTSLSGRKSNEPRSSTPPAGIGGSKSFRSARLLRHQASLKTSSILAKLVGGASKRSTYLGKSSSKQQQSDIDDNDADTDTGNQHQQPSTKNDDSSSIDSNIVAVTTPSSNKCILNTSNSDLNNPVISPLSSVSSLNSTNSSINVNSACASSSNKSCELLYHSFSTSCCAGVSSGNQMMASNIGYIEKERCESGMRSRSATVPSRSSIDATKNIERLGSPDEAEPFKVCEIIADSVDKVSDSDNIEKVTKNQEGSSLWLGCDDGSLIIIDCLSNHSDDLDCNLCDQDQKNLNCGNLHSEIKLGATICDISVYKNEMVFVALANGQLAIFHRDYENYKTGTWSLTNPKLLIVTTNELNSRSHLCIVNNEHIWYSYGRNVFVLNIATLKLETTIMTPTNDLSLQFTKQSIAIDNMELMDNLSGVWISFRNSHLLHFYDVKSYKLLIEINLFDPISRILSYGNEVIRHHKTACLKATSLLAVNNDQDHCSTLFIGTSAGIVLYMNIDHHQFNSRETLFPDWKPQIASLRHGHSGGVKFLHLIEIQDGIEFETSLDSNNNIKRNEKEFYLISGGTGVDFYGPNDEQQNNRLNSDEDNLNHLMLWQLGKEQFS